MDIPAIAFDSQVGGHSGIRSSADGSVIIKPALPVEVDFYTTLSSSDALTHLFPFVPRFYGTLKLQGQLDEQGNITSAPQVEEGSKDSIVLQNLTYTFSKVNVLDIKLGTVLYDDNATPEKKERMQKKAEQSTSFETGVRLTGFNVYDHTEGKAKNTPKSYGYSITKEQLPEGISAFFPLATSDIPTGTGLPKDLLQHILEGIVTEVEAIRNAVSRTEMRIVASSLLIIYEADWDKLRKSIELWKQEEQAFEDDDASEREDSDDTEESDDNLKKGPPYLVKLIDFGHTRLTPGEGPDDRALLGIDTTLKLLRERLAHISSN